MKSEDDCFLAGKLWQTYRQYVEKQKHYSVNKGPYSQGYGLPSGHIRLWELDCKEGRAPKNWCLRIVVPEKTPKSPLDSKEIKPVNLKRNQSWIFLEGLMLKLNFGHLIWSPNFGHLIRTANSLEKTLMLGKIEDRRRRGQQRPLTPSSAFNFSLLRDFANESSVCIRWLKCWSSSFSISPSNEYSGLISLKIDWFDLLAV